VRPADVDELTEGDPREVALENARRKALWIYSHAPTPEPTDLVLGADTDVALDGDILGKPHDAAHARELVGRLNGRTHEVVGGIALARAGTVIATAVEVTRVTFRDSDVAALDRYVATGEWQGRAGGYAIQGEGGKLVDRIEGDYLNVVGLPLHRLQELLAAL
jgi:septum formation protein